MGLEERNDNQLISRMIHECSSCGECLRGCTFLEIHGTPAAIAGRGNAESNLLSAFQCSLCGLCDAVCPEALSPSEMFLEMRQKASEMGLVDLKKYSPWINYEKLGGSFLLRRYIIPDGCKTVFFPGCSLPGTRPDAVLGLYRMLLKQNSTIGLVLDCCGKISHDLGLANRFDSIFSLLASRLQTEGITSILTACPGCSKIFRNYGLAFEVTSVYESLMEGQGAGFNFSQLSRGKGQDSGPISPHGPQSLPPVFIHDPCPARFDTNQQQAVRSLVQAFGYTVAELPSHGPTSRCCGQGGMVEGCVPGTVMKESAVIGQQAAGCQLISSCGACCDTLAPVTPTAHIADLVTGTAGFTDRPVSSLKRWLNRLQLKFARLT